MPVVPLGLSRAFLASRSVASRSLASRYFVEAMESNGRQWDTTGSETVIGFQIRAPRQREATLRDEIDRIHRSLRFDGFDGFDGFAAKITRLSVSPFRK